MTFSEQLKTKIAAADFSDCRATVVGYGNMGKEFVLALQALKVGQITVCSLSAQSLLSLKEFENITVFDGGYQNFKRKPDQDELAIVATPTAHLIPAALHLRELGYRKFLIEKPVSLWSEELREFYEAFADQKTKTVCGYNRAAYPALLELKHLTRLEGGITSCTYTFTEFTDRINPKAYSDDEAGRWGIANSLHVMSMAHTLIGMPKTWEAHCSGSAVSWHPAGSVFVGSGISEQDIPFVYHADWGSTGRWSLEVHTRKASYRCCPLEQLSVRRSFKEEWKEVPIACFAPDVKVGFAEQVAALFQEKIGCDIPLISLEGACRLIEFGEDVFGYENKK